MPRARNPLQNSTTVRFRSPLTFASCLADHRDRHHDAAERFRPRSHAGGGAAPAADEGPPDARRDPGRRARAGLAHGPGRSVDRRSRRGHADEQVRRVRAFRLARRAADLGGARIPREVRGRDLRALDRRGTRAAAAARDVRPLVQARLGRDRRRLHLHQRRGRVRRPSRPGARCARQHGADVARCARAGDPHRGRRGPPARQTPIRSRCCSRSTA